jgi:hypothetical protein
MKKALIINVSNGCDALNLIKKNANRINIGSSALLLTDQHQDEPVFEYLLSYTKSKYTFTFSAPVLIRSRFPQGRIKFCQNIDVTDADINLIELNNLNQDSMEQLMKIYSSLDIQIIIAVESRSDESIRACLNGRISKHLVASSAEYLDGAVVSPSLQKYWLAFKFQNALTRPSNWDLIETRENFIDNCSDGIVQWGHLLNEIAFMLGFAPKYGA